MKNSICKPLCIFFAIGTILGLIMLIIVFNPDITLSMLDTLKPICGKFGIETRAEAQSYILIYTAVCFVGCFTAILIAFKEQKVASKMRRNRIHHARELRQTNSISINTKVDLAEAIKNEEKLAEEKVEKEHKPRFKKHKKEIEDNVEVVVDDVSTEVVETAQETKEVVDKKASETIDTAKQTKVKATNKLQSWIDEIK